MDEFVGGVVVGTILTLPLLGLPLLLKARTSTRALSERVEPRMTIRKEAAEAFARLSERLAAERRSQMIDAYLDEVEKLNQSFDQGLMSQLEAEGQDILACGRTADFREGVTAFIEKRTAQFEGR